MPLDEVIVPDNIYASSGNGVHVSASEGKRELWRRGVEEIRKFGEASGILVSEIPKQQYLEAMGDYTSVQFDLGYEVPFSQFCDYYGIRKSQSFDAVEAVSAIAWSSASGESLFVVQEQKEKYYRLVADDNYTRLRSLAEEIFQSGDAAYYPISTLMGVENTTMIPWEASVDSGSVLWRSERQTGEDEDVRRLAQSFFGENFDFIRRMVDSKGNITYMYGYGQKTFITYQNGLFEYKEEIDDSAGGQPMFYGSLEAALQFIASHGSWHTFDSEPVSLFLSRAKVIERGKKRGYRFEFGLLVDEVPVYYDSEVPIAVEILNGQVTYYQRYLIQPVQESHSQEIVQTNLANVIASNCDEVYQLIERESDEEILFGEERLTRVAGEISDVRLGYFCSLKDADSGYRQEMLPAWIVTIDHKLQVYFDIGSGQLLSSQQLKQ